MCGYRKNSPFQRDGAVSPVLAKAMHSAPVVVWVSIQQLVHGVFVFTVTVADLMASQLVLPGAEKERCQKDQKLTEPHGS